MPSFQTNALMAPLVGDNNFGIILPNRRFSRDVPPPCWWTKTKDFSLASFVRPPEVVLFFIVLGVSRGWLKTTNCMVWQACSDKAEFSFLRRDIAFWCSLECVTN